MSGVALFVIGFIVVCVAVIFGCIVILNGREAREARALKNLIRMRIARKTGAYQYLHEGSDGSFYWRSVSAN